MEKNRQTKVIAIIALVVAVIGMSVGFAAFSNTLTISSSATVTPNEEDFKLVAYGVGQQLEEEIMEDTSIYTSTTTSIPWKYWGATGTAATINNNSAAGTISFTNLEAGFTQPDQLVDYWFIIKNEGAYDAYIDITNFKNYASSNISKTCTPGTGATTTLVNAACEGITATVEAFSNTAGTSLDSVERSFNLEAGDFIYAHVLISYLPTAARSDGPFTVDFEDLTISFSTAA